MEKYFTLSKSPTESIVTIYPADGFERALQYKQGLIRDGAYQEDQITISGMDSQGNVVNG